MKVAVAGSGIIGLWTAYELTKYGHEVTVYSNAPVNATTSSSAVAVITPLFPWDRASDPVAFEQSLKWYYETLAEFLRLNVGNDFLNIIPSYEFGYEDENNDRVLEKAFSVTKLRDLNFAPLEILSVANPIKVKNDDQDTHHVSFAAHFDADMVDTQIFLPLFEQILRQRGVRFSHQVFASREDILDTLDEPVVFNCLGMNAKYVFPDLQTEMHPTRGQSHFIRIDLEPPYFGIASGHHAVFRHKRGYYLGSFFLEDARYTHRTKQPIDSNAPAWVELNTFPTSDVFELTKGFIRESYPRLAYAVGHEPDEMLIRSIDASPDDSNIPLAYKVWRMNTGIRPMRESGPYCSVESQDERTIVHHFGHGAHGWTIGYGSTKEAVRTWMNSIGGSHE